VKLPPGLVYVDISDLVIRAGGDAAPPFAQLVAFVSEQVGGATPGDVYLSRADFEALLSLASGTTTGPRRRYSGPWVAPLLRPGRAVVRSRRT
jgi:hypothetical protein